MAFPSFTDNEKACIWKVRTYSAVADYDTYNDACACFDCYISANIPASSYLDAVYVGFHGSSNIGTGSQVYAFWVDWDWSGTNGGNAYLMRLSVQGAATSPDAFIQIQGTQPEYLFYFAGPSVAYIDSGAVGGSQDKKLHVSVNGTGYYIPLHTA